MMGQIEDDAAALELARALLSEDRTGITLREVAPDPKPTDIGARAGFGAVALDIDLRLNAYVFGAWGEGTVHAARLEQTLDGPNRQVRSAANGRLLLIASTGRGTQEKYWLNTLCSAFAGME